MPVDEAELRSRISALAEPGRSQALRLLASIIRLEERIDNLTSATVVENDRRTARIETLERELAKENRDRRRRIREREAELERLPARRWFRRYYVQASARGLRGWITRRTREVEDEVAGIRGWISRRTRELGAGIDGLQEEILRLREELEELLKRPIKAWNLVEYTKYYEYPGKRPVNVELRARFTVAAGRDPEDFWDVIERIFDIAFMEAFGEDLADVAEHTQVGAEVIERDVPKFEESVDVSIMWKGARTKWRVTRAWGAKADVRESELT